LTIAELAKMILAEGWLENGVQPNIEIVPMSGYDHSMEYKLPVKPSPNLPNAQSIGLYPSLALFEGTHISAGRGTDFPFQTFGHPKLKNMNFTFTPISNDGSKYPKWENKKVHGMDLRNASVGDSIEWTYLIQAYQNLPEGEDFFINTNFFDLLAGNYQIRKLIKAKASEEEIRKSYQAELDDYKRLRKKYVIYE
jgi:uncharacterized protein YbbC (DUF1343 family)